MGRWSGKYLNEIGDPEIENPVHIRDLHATMLRLPGIDQERLSFPFRGRDQRLSAVEKAAW